MIYFVHIGILLAIYMALLLSLDLSAGRTGQLSLAHGAYFAIGAYASAMTAVDLWNFFPMNILAAFLAGMLLSLLFSVPAIRLSRDLVVLTTFALHIVLLNIIRNSEGVTRGSFGIRGIPKPNFGFFAVSGSFPFFLLSLGLVLGTVLLYRIIVRSPMRLLLAAIREDELLSLSLGRRVERAKIQVIAVTCSLAATAGAIYAHYIGFIDPATFPFTESLLLLIALLLGGPNSVTGAFLGACILVVLPEALRFIGVPGPHAGHIREAFFGVAIVLLAYWKPHGISGNARMVV